MVFLLILLVAPAPDSQAPPASRSCRPRLPPPPSVAPLARICLTTRPEPRRHPPPLATTRRTTPCATSPLCFLVLASYLATAGAAPPPRAGAVVPRPLPCHLASCSPSATTGVAPSAARYPEPQAAPPLASPHARRLDQRCPAPARVSARVATAAMAKGFSCVAGSSSNCCPVHRIAAAAGLPRPIPRGTSCSTTQRAPSTTTIAAALLRTQKPDRQVPQRYHVPLPSQEPRPASPKTPSTTTTLEDVGSVKFDYNTCTTTIAVYHYFHYRRENVYFRYGRVQLLPLPPTCTTTTRVQLLPLRPASTTTFLDEIKPLRNARFEASVSFRSCEDSFDYVRLSSSWNRSSSLRDLSLQVPMLPSR
ncbi:hypothetical protein VPH35_071209 [Triticum aestivum]